MLDLSDSDLVKRAKKGNVKAVGELYDRHHEPIFRYVRSRVSDQAIAEDLTGEIFIRMVDNLSGYRNTNVPFQAWLYRIAHNLVVDHYRKENGRSFVPLYHAEGMNGKEDNPDSMVEQRLTIEKVRQALDKIDPTQREVVELRFLAGLSLKEVASALDRTVASVKTLQHRGLKALRVAMKQVQVP